MLSLFIIYFSHLFFRNGLEWSYFHILLESSESVPGNSCVIEYTELSPL